MKTAVSNETMRYSDIETIKSGIPSTELMYRAGKGIYETEGIKWDNTAVICGKGNNGGDGYVLALFIKKGGGTPKLILIEEEFSEDGRFYFEKCLESGIEYEIYSEKTDFSVYDTIADCIFGTGFHGIASGRAAECIKKINESGKFVISADINSGLSGDSGMGNGVVSDITVAVGSYKAGHFLGAAKDCIKELRVIDIGIQLKGESFFVPEENDFGSILKKRQYNSHKGNYGYTAIIGGCAEYSGAAKLANLACSALKSGCGVTKLCVSQGIAAAVMPYLLESTLFTMPDKNGHMKYDKERLNLLLRGTASASCGMGWGMSGEEDNKKIIEYLLGQYGGTLIIDADGLNTLAKMPDGILRSASCRKIILTPHPLEFSRISGFSVTEIAENPIGCAKKFLYHAGEKVILLLKGTATVVADSKEVYIVNRGCPGMATAGSGDVLSGILTGIMGYSEPSAKSAACGAYIAGLAGELAEKDVGSSISMTSSDTVRFIPEAVRRMC